MRRYFWNLRMKLLFYTKSDILESAVNNAMCKVLKFQQVMYPSNTTQSRW
jgi:hypothetical protein